MMKSTLPILSVLVCLGLIACRPDDGNRAGLEADEGGQAGSTETREMVEIAEEREVRLVASPPEIEAGEQLNLQVENHASQVVQYGRPITVERWTGLRWVETDASRDTMWTMELLSLQPGESGVEQHWPFFEDDRPEPGRYRLRKRVHVPGEEGDAGKMELEVEVRVRE